MKNIRELYKIFYENLHVYNSLVEYELNDIGYASKTKDITLNAITNIEKVAQELNLYGDEWKTDLDYLDEYIIPRLKQFFKENLYKGDDEMNNNEKIKMIEECFEEFYNDVDENGCPLDNITRYDVFDSVEDIIKIPTKKGDDTMKVNEEIELSGILEMDLEEIREHFKNNTDDWIFDHDLSQWIYMPTNQTVRGYILSNIETILSPNLLKEDVEKILWFENFEEILDELSDVELLTTLTTQEPTDKGHKIYLFGSHVYITPKQWRQIIYEATRRFIRRDE